MPKVSTLNTDSVLTYVDGFFILPITFPDAFGTRYLYVKEDRSTENPHNCRLFVANVSDFNEEQLRTIFGSSGEIASVEFGRIAQGGARMAYITYAERSSLLQLLKTLKTDPSTISCTASSTITSSTSPVLESYYQRVSSEYAKPASVLRKEAEEALVRYEEEENAIQNETDADGWTTVRRRKRAGDDEIITAMQIKEMKRREAMQKKDFYKFQGRENRRDQLRELREKFERDRARVEKMKQNRKINFV